MDQNASRLVPLPVRDGLVVDPALPPAWSAPAGLVIVSRGAASAAPAYEADLAVIDHRLLRSDPPTHRVDGSGRVSGCGCRMAGCNHLDGAVVVVCQLYVPMLAELARVLAQGARLYAVCHWFSKDSGYFPLAGAAWREHEYVVDAGVAHVTRVRDTHVFSVAARPHYLTSTAQYHCGRFVVSDIVATQGDLRLVRFSSSLHAPVMPRSDPLVRTVVVSNLQPGFFWRRPKYDTILKVDADALEYAVTKFRTRKPLSECFSTSSQVQRALTDWARDHGRLYNAAEVLTIAQAGYAESARHAYAMGLAQRGMGAVSLAGTVEPGEISFVRNAKNAIRDFVSRVLFPAFADEIVSRLPPPRVLIDADELKPKVGEVLSVGVLSYPNRNSRSAIICHEGRLPMNPAPGSGNLFAAVVLRLGDGVESNPRVDRLDAAVSLLRTRFRQRHGALPAPASRTYGDWRVLCSRADDATRMAALDRAARTNHASNASGVNCMLQPFIKDESYVGLQDTLRPRAICAPSDRYLALVAPHMHVVNEMLKEAYNGERDLLYYSGENMLRFGEFVERALASYSDPVIIENDFSAFESCIGPELLDLEFAFYDSVVEMPVAVREALRMQKVCHVKVDDFEYRRKGGRASGVPNTSSGNTIINMALLRFAVGRPCHMVVLGDDNLVICERVPLDEIKVRLESFGMRPTLKGWDPERLEQAEFCNRYLARDDAGNIGLVAKTGRVLAKSFTIAHANHNTAPTIGGTAAGFLAGGHDPILAEVCDALLRVTGAQTKLVDSYVDTPHFVASKASTMARYGMSSDRYDLAIREIRSRGRLIWGWSIGPESYLTPLFERDVEYKFGPDLSLRPIAQNLGEPAEAVPMWPHHIKPQTTRARKAAAVAADPGPDFELDYSPEWHVPGAKRFRGGGRGQQLPVTEIPVPTSRPSPARSYLSLLLLCFALFIMADTAALNGLSEAGRQWFTLATDLFHDEKLAIVGIPDNSPSPFYTEYINEQFTVGRTSGASYDVYVLTMPLLNGALVTTADFVHDATGGYWDVPASGTTSAYNLINIVTVDTGQDPFTHVSRSVTQVGITSTNSHPKRLVSLGFEVTDVTPAMYKQGSLTAWRSESGLAPGCELVNRPPNSNIVVPCAFGKMPIFSPQMATQVPGSVTWEASKGCYMMCPLDTAAMSYSTPSRENMILAGVTTANSRGLITQMQIPPAHEDGESAVATRRIAYHNHPLIGCVLAGMNGTVGVQTIVIRAVFQISPIQDTALMRSCKTPPSADLKALALYSETVKRLPVAVPVNMNAKGDWWRIVKGVVSSVGRTVPRFFQSGQFAVPVDAVNLLKNELATTVRSIRQANSDAAARREAAGAAKRARARSTAAVAARAVQAVRDAAARAPARRRNPRN